MSTPSHIRHTRDSNQAGGPLPIIPRRATRSQSMPTCASSTERPILSPPPHDWSQNALESDSSSSSTSGSSTSTTRARRKRVKGVRTGASSPPRVTSALSPPQDIPDLFGQTCQRRVVHGAFDRDRTTSLSGVSAPRPLVYTPGTLRLSVETMRTHMLTDARPHPCDPRASYLNGSKTAPPQESKTADGSRLVIRKKSGQPVKSSLKSSRCTRGNLSIVTIGTSSKSEPPTPKAVHFDPQLEHIKLFLAEQKPLAVSRDGSPTEDTSGTDSDFPSFIYGKDDEARPSRKKLVMRPINIVPKSDLDAKVVLEDFYLNFDGTNILGKIRVRNIAFAKTVTVRFTFDSWQTTSEVNARYAESINPQFDRFSFSIRLNDMLSRIEGKTLVMAVRYNVNGQEFWDNNHHQDYVATFTKAKVARESKRSDGGNVDDVKSLQSRLERVARRDNEHSESIVVPQKLATKEPELPSLKSGIALSSRYDFAASLRNSTSWKPNDIPAWASPPKSARALSPPSRDTSSSVDLCSPSTIPWPEKSSPPNRSTTLPAYLPPLKGQLPMMSPRDFEEERVFLPSHPLVHDSVQNTDRGRNHRRGFSADAAWTGFDSAMKRTPHGTPALDSSPSSIRHHSFPPLLSPESTLSSHRPKSFGLQLNDQSFSNARQPPSPPSTSPDFSRGFGLSSGESSADSELSTPSLSTPTSSRSPTPSPTEPFMKPTLPPLPLFGDGDNMLQPLQPLSPGTHYRHFLNQFCFFTGSSPSSGSGVPITENSYRAEVTKSHSDVCAATNPSFGDIVTTCDDSGTSTPTVPSGKWGSRPGTPVTP
ncbi:hypothetical protein NP233_g9345 [Leucocoprinus birnbaumii]|uniref:CBM21 domain-containing protein n=1 Tax=Leucocoprinus birnbaumii TaxID=56174 RepID=A0AAD5VL72_9AGAR|nr:hypothetical protein NP233_g9345 [Leucocoprinus birnbaumii]